MEVANFEEKLFPRDGGAVWTGMGNYCLVSPDKERRVILAYVGEPAHGDSYHQISIDGRAFPGYAWGCMFAFSPESRYLAFSWMAALIQRKTAVADVVERRYFVLPDYIHDFRFNWPLISGQNKSKGHSYEFTGEEKWVSY